MVLAAAAFLPVAARQDVSVRPTFADAARIAEWDVDGSGQWQIANGMLILAKPGVASGPIRRPAAIAILKTPPRERGRM